MWKGVTLDSIPVRTTPDGGAIGPYLPKGAVLSIDRVDGTWLHFVNYNGTRAGWVNAGANMTKVRWEAVTVTPPPTPTKRLTNIINVYEDGSINVIPQ